jgi:hypothetical protein
MKISNWFIGGLVVVFFTLSFKAFQDAQPEKKSDRIYTEIRKYSPYYLEKRVGGFRIMMKGSTEKEEPPITDVFNRLDTLDKGWGEKSMSIDNENLIIKDKEQKEVAKIKFENKEEKEWVIKFYMLEKKK